MLLVLAAAVSAVGWAVADRHRDDVRRKSADALLAIQKVEAVHQLELHWLVLNEAPPPLGES